MKLPLLTALAVAVMMTGCSAISGLVKSVTDIAKDAGNLPVAVATNSYQDAKSVLSKAP